MIRAYPTPAGLKLPTREPMYKDLHVERVEDAELPTWIVTNVNREILGRIEFENDELNPDEQKKIAEQFGADLLAGAREFVYEGRPVTTDETV